MIRTGYPSLTVFARQKEERQRRENPFSWKELTKGGDNERKPSGDHEKMSTGRDSIPSWTGCHIRAWLLADLGRKAAWYSDSSRTDA